VRAQPEQKQTAPDGNLFNRDPVPTGEFAVRSSKFIPGLVTLIALSIFPRATLADHERPYKGKLVSTTTSVTPTPEGLLYFETVVAGRGNMLGKFTGAASYLVNPLDGSFTGTLTKVAANGDEVYESFIGQFNADFTESVGIFWIDGGTGRFAGATGGGSFTGVVTSPITIAIRYAGVIEK
jgi:hypothetical protein